MIAGKTAPFVVDVVEVEVVVDVVGRVLVVDVLVVGLVVLVDVDVVVEGFVDVVEVVVEVVGIVLVVDVLVVGLVVLVEVDVVVDGFVEEVELEEVDEVEELEVEVVAGGAFTVNDPPSILAVLPWVSTKMHLRLWLPESPEVLTSAQTVFPL